MKTINASQIIAIPKGVKVDVAARQVTVTGPRGTLKKDFRHLQIDMIKIGGKRLKVEMWWGKHKQIAAVRTACSHIENMILGVTKGYRYKMRFVYAHFPINAAIVDEGKTIEIRNFLGEKEVRKVTVYDGVILTRSEDVKDEIVLTGNDVEAVSQSAANIHQSTLVRDKDIRKFLDGIYVSEGGVIEN